MRPDQVTVGSGASSDATKFCARTVGARTSARTVIPRPRVTHLHITPTSNPIVPFCFENRATAATPIHCVLPEFILTRVASSNVTAAVGVEDVRAAAGRIRPYIHRTPLLPSRSLSENVGAEVRLKCENLQRAGSFKIRGAMNALLQLSDEERCRGVVAFSSGNHAQGVALAAKLLGMRATIVMPEGSVAAKVKATEAYGAQVVTAGVTAATRDTVAREIADKTGAAVIPPFDDERSIAGAGTVGLESV